MCVSRFNVILARCLLALRLGGSALPAAGVAAIGAGRILAARCLGGCGRSGLRGRLARLCGGFPLTRGLLRLRGAAIASRATAAATVRCTVRGLCSFFHNSPESCYTPMTRHSL